MRFGQGFNSSISSAIKHRLVTPKGSTEINVTLLFAGFKIFLYF